MILKNPVHPLLDTPKNRKEISNLSQKQWNKLSNTQKLSRIALCEQLGDFSLIKIEYNRDNLIKEYIIEKNDTDEKLKQNLGEIIKKLEEDLKTRQTEYDELKNDMELIKLTKKSIKTELEVVKCKNKQLESLNKKLTLTKIQQEKEIEKLNDAISHEKDAGLYLKLKESEANVRNLNMKMTNMIHSNEYYKCKSRLNKKEYKNKLLKTRIHNIGVIFNGIVELCPDQFQELSDEINQ